MTEDKAVIAGTQISLSGFSGINEQTVVKAFLQFIDVANTSTNRATAYNTKEEQLDAANKIHRNLYSIDRGVYAASMLLTGVTDHTKMLGIENLLGTINGRDRSSLPIEVETNIIAYLLGTIPVQRMLNMYLELKSNRVNNARTRRIILLSILNSKSLEFWAIKYRTKIRKSLEHAWGRRQTSILKTILNKKVVDWNAKEHTIVGKYINQYINAGKTEDVYQCVSFILGNNSYMTLPKLKAFIDARTDINAGKVLPREVLEGIRSTYHRNTPSSVVLELTKQQLTDKEKMKVQKNAQKHNVKVEFDPTKQTAVDLYIHSYAQKGITPAIQEALEKKANQTALTAPINYEKIAIVVDASGSSFGDDTQALRPMAISMSIRDMLVAKATESVVIYCGGKKDGDLVYPQGATNLATPLVKALKHNPDAVFIISDGYENAPAGRVNEVLQSLDKIGIDIPIYQVCPVMSAEASGIKKLSSKVAALPANSPGSLGLGMVKAMLEQDLQAGIKGIYGLTLPMLSKGNRR